MPQIGDVRIVKKGNAPSWTYEVFEQSFAGAQGRWTPSFRYCWTKRGVVKAARQAKAEYFDMNGEPIDGFLCGGI